MKAISLKQPWASLVANGVKTIETRVWQTKHRGALLICSSQKTDHAFWKMVTQMTDCGPMPQGKALCVVDVIDCRPMEKSDEDNACCRMYDRAQAWVIVNVRKIKPFDVCGSLGLFEVSDSRIEYVK